jgi:MSHA biogenesis protein MshN
MSLINKMLQDLDARGTAPGQSFPSNIKPVAREPYRMNKRAAAAAVAGSFAGLAVAWFGWSQYQAARPARTPVPVPVAAPAAKPAPIAPAAPAAGMASTITVTPAGSAPAAEAVFDAAAEAKAPAKTQKVEQADKAERALPALRREEQARIARARRQEAGYVAPAAKTVAPVEPDSPEAREARRAMMAELEARETRKATLAARARSRAGTVADKRAAAAGRQESATQRAEGEYRRALASMQDGRMIETIASLESALRIDPSHEAARQTLVGLLVEQKRTDEAMRQLQLGLTQDPRQPALAMLLARLQIEGGGSGIETLTRTLPYVGANPDYRAFLAGALQRQQRHREAAAEYQTALRGAPANAVWWMGLGISLQLDKRNAEALEAFQKARSSGTLSQELQAFVERKVQQLGR